MIMKLSIKNMHVNKYKVDCVKSNMSVVVYNLDSRYTINNSPECGIPLELINTPKNAAKLNRICK